MKPRETDATAKKVGDGVGVAEKVVDAKTDSALATKPVRMIFIR